jgi:hypothetical protein
MTPRSLLVRAHGTAAESGAVLVAEPLPLDELRPLDARRTEAALASRRVRGRPFQIGNTAASDRGASLTRINVDASAPEEHRKVHRKAASLQRQRRRELEVQHGGPVSSAVNVELVAWARNTAWAELYDRAGDATKAAALAEKASGHQLKAIGIAEREATAKPAPVEQFPWMTDDADDEPTDDGPPASGAPKEATP